LSNNKNKKKKEKEEKEEEAWFAYAPLNILN
jgi:hypothetical protein